VTLSVGPTTPLQAAARPAARVPRVGRRLSGRALVRRLLWHAVLIGCSVVALVPIAYMVLTSLRPLQGALTGSLIPTHLTFKAYSYAWNTVQIWRNVINSVIITGSSVVLIVMCATLAGYAFGRLRFTGRQLLFAVIVSALFLPGVATLIPVYLEMKQLGLLGSRFGLVLLYVAGGIPLSIFLMRTFFEALPAELSEAARIDGANELQVFLRIMLPLALPGIGTIAILQLVNVWNELLFASALLSDPNQRPLQPAATQLIGQYATNWPVLTAAMTISALPMVILYVVFQRWFVAGLAAGAVKS